MNRLHRKIASLLAAAAMLFAQLAGSVYACPMQFAAMQEALDSNTAALTTADTTPLALDLVTPALCDQHSLYGKQTINDAPQPLVAVALAPAFVVNVDYQPLPSVPPTATAPSRLADSSPPLAVRNCCFRI